MATNDRKETKQEFLLSCLRTISARCRQYILEVETIGVAVKNGRITDHEGTEWARETGLLDQRMLDALTHWSDVDDTATLPGRHYSKHPTVVALGREASSGASGDGVREDENSLSNRKHGAG